MPIQLDGLDYQSCPIESCSRSGVR